MIIVHRPGFLKSGQLVTGSTKLLYKGTDGTSRAIDPDNYALKSEVEGVVGDMNDELVKYGKEMISKAITEKGVPTASTEMFDQMASNIRSINSYSGSSALNIYCQTDKPDVQNGLWIKRDSSEINDIQIKNGIYVADGTADIIKSDMEYCLCGGWSGLVGSIVYCLSGYRVSGDTGNSGPGTAILSSNNSLSYGYDIENDIFTRVPFVPDLPSGNSLESLYRNSFPQTNLVYNNNIYVISFYGSSSSQSMAFFVWIYDTKTSITTRIDLINPYSGNITNITAARIIGNKMYITININSTGILSEIDLDTNTVTLITSNLNTTAYAPIIINGDIIELCTKSGLQWGVNLTTKIATKYSNVVPIYHYKDTSTSSYSAAGRSIQIGDLLYAFGGMSETDAIDTYTTLACKSVSIYNIKTKETIGIDNILPQPYGIQYNYYYAYYKGNVYLIGGFYHGSGINYANRKWYHTIVKFAINSKDLDNGTIVCDPSSYFNSTEMYNDGKTKLDFGVNQVYYQSAEGFSIQPAAVIKNSTIININ